MHHVDQWNDLNYKEETGRKSWGHHGKQFMENKYSALEEVFCVFLSKAELEQVWDYELGHWLTGKDPDAGKDWRQEEKGTAEDEMIGWHHWLDGHDSEQALGVGDGQGSLTYCSPWVCKESDTTEQLNWTKYFPASVFPNGSLHQMTNILDLLHQSFQWIFRVDFL